MKTIKAIAHFNSFFQALGLCLSLTLLSLSLAHAKTIGSNLETNLIQKKSSVSEPSLGMKFSITSPTEFKFGKISDKDNFSASAEYWSQSKWGLSGKVQENEFTLPSLPVNSESARINLNRKVLGSATSNSYLAFGVGWQSVNLSDEFEVEGLSFSLLGKLALADNVSLYGTGDLFQGYEENVSNSEVTGYLLEAGLNYKVGAKFSFSAGLKLLDLEDQQFNRKSQSSSFLIGTHLSF